MTEEAKKTEGPAKPPIPLTAEDVAVLLPLVCKTLVEELESASTEIRGCLIIASLDSVTGFLGMVHNRSPVRMEIREEAHKRLHAWVLEVLKKAAGREPGDTDGPE